MVHDEEVHHAVVRGEEDHREEIHDEEDRREVGRVDQLDGLAQANEP